MFDEPFSQGTSFLHRIDPRFRIALAILCAVGLAVLRNIEAAGLGLAFSFILLLFSRPEAGAVCKRLAVINIFIVFLWLTVPLSMDGDPIAVWGPFHVSKDGVLLTLLVTLKCNAIALIFLALVATMDSSTLGYALERIHFPSKLVFLLLFTYRYIHVIDNEWKKLYAAAKLRGFEPKTNLRTYSVLANMLGMVFVRSFERSLRVYEAMQLRGFCGKFRSVTSFQTGRRDMLFAGLVAICLGCVMLLDFIPGKFHV